MVRMSAVLLSLLSSIAVSAAIGDDAKVCRKVADFATPVFCDLVGIRRLVCPPPGDSVVLPGTGLLDGGAQCYYALESSCPLAPIVEVCKTPREWLEIERER
jgi:hypothetical protein